MSGNIVCNGDCGDCDFTYWKWIKKTGLLISSDDISLHDCEKIIDEEIK